MVARDDIGRGVVRDDPKPRTSTVGWDQRDVVAGFCRLGARCLRRQPRSVRRCRHLRAGRRRLRRHRDHRPARARPRLPQRPRHDDDRSARHPPGPAGLDGHPPRSDGCADRPRCHRRGKARRLRARGGCRSATVQQGHRTSISLLLWPFERCLEGALYCGGLGLVLADTQSLYRCTGGVPLYYARCSSGCTPFQDANGYCVGTGGRCRDGGAYCGGHALDGDPFTLYICEGSRGTEARKCSGACLVQGDGNDACQ